MGYFAGGRRRSTDSRRTVRAGCDLGPIHRGSTRSMTLLLAAFGATVTALLELTVGPYLRFGIAQPHLVLVCGIVVTVAIGLEAGLVWAFVGGLVLDVLAQRPLGSTAFALLLCVGFTAVLGRLLLRLRPIVPILATLLLSLFYSMTLYVAFNALRTPIPVADPIGIAAARRRLRHDPRGIDRAACDLDPRSPDRIGTARLVSTFYDERPRPVRNLSRFLVFALAVVIAVTGLTARLFYLQIVDGGRLATLATHNRTVQESIPAPRGLIYDRNGRALVTNVATFVVKLRPADLPLDQRPVVVDRLAALLGMPATDINATIDGNPGSTFDLVRIATDVDERTARLISEAGFELPGSRGRGRGETAVRRRAADVADPRLHGSGLRRATPRPEAGRLPPRRPDRQGRHRSAVREQPAGHLRHAECRAGRLGSEDPGPPDARHRRSRATR